MRAQNDVLQPSLPRPVAPEVQRRLDQGNAFEASAVLDMESTGVVRSVALEDQDLEAASDIGVTVIFGARLPTDDKGRRVGRPDLLVRALGGGYRAVDVKHHLVLDAVAAQEQIAPALISSMEQPTLEDAAPDERFTARKREDDLLQLAHYQRMLEAAGLGADGGRWAGVFGTERRIVWFDLDAPMWRTTSASGQQMQSTMEKYDAEFGLRLEIIAAAMAHQADPSVDLLAAPVRIGECDECPWWDYCRARLQEGPGDISLLPRLGRREVQIHHDHGVTNRAELASLDPVTARLVCSGIDVIELQRLVEGLPDETPVRDLGVVVRAKTQLARLESEGVTTFGAVMRLDRRTASYYGAGTTWLPEQIDLARAALGPLPIYRRRGVRHVGVPRADVEVDIDMENIEEGVYLWGALHTTRADGVAVPTYHSFVTWDRLTPDEEASNFAALWQWLQAMKAEARNVGKTFRAYCYNASAENTYLRKLGLQLGILGEVSDFIRSDEWVDLLRVVDGQLITGTGSGLKAIAPLSGFNWAVDDPGGGISMVQYDIAAQDHDSAERRAARDWLLTYNRGDVEATLAIRDWLENTAESLPTIESIRPEALQVAAIDRNAG